MTDVPAYEAALGDFLAYYPVPFLAQGLEQRIAGMLFECGCRNTVSDGIYWHCSEMYPVAPLYPRFIKRHQLFRAPFSYTGLH